MNKSDKGRLEIEVTDHDGHPIKEEVVVLLNQNAAQFGSSVRLKGKSGAAITGEVSAGPYTLQALAKGYEVGREFIEVHADRGNKANLRLKASAGHARQPLAERLQKRYGIKLEGAAQNLTVAERGKVSLNYRQDSDGTHLRVLKPESLSDLKRWVGSPEGIIPGKHPRFGSLPPVNEGKVTEASLTAIANEFVYGNAQAVNAHNLGLVNSQISKVGIAVPIFFFQDVVILNGAVLEIGNGSSVFVCNTLTIHPTGILTAVGPVRADIGTVHQL